MASDLLNPFEIVQLGPLIAKYEDWILFTILLFFFWAIVGISLRKHFERSKSLKVLIVTLAAMFAISTYFSIYKGWLHLSLQGLGMFGVTLLFVTIFFITYGMIRGYGMQGAKALCIGYVLFYISIRAVSPNILHTLADIFPLGNLILLVLFIFSLVKIVSSFFRHSKEKGEESSRFAPPQMTQKFKPDPISIGDIDHKIINNKQEKQALNTTKKEIKSIDELDNDLQDILKILNKKNQPITPALIDQLNKTISGLGPKLRSLMNGFGLINKQLNLWEPNHKQDIEKLNLALKNTTDKKQSAEIKQQLTYQKRMVEVQSLFKEIETKIKKFYDQFLAYLKPAISMINNREFNRASEFIERAQYDLQEIKQSFKILKQIETYILKLDKKLIRN